MGKSTKLGVVILANTVNDSIENVTIDCINSLYKSEEANSKICIDTLIIESNKKFDINRYKVNKNVEVVTPSADFNFHKFLNIGISHFRNTHDFIALCNNDLIFKDDWFTEMLKAKALYPKALSFSPFDNEKGNAEMKDKVSIGYIVREHIKGWCIVAQPEVFEKTGLLDEGFDFYCADDDYALNLRKHNIQHLLVYSSHVVHLERKNSAELRDMKDTFFQAKILDTLPSYLQNKEWAWLLKNEKALEGHLKLNRKWGTPSTVALKNRMSKITTMLGLGFLNRFIY